MKQLSSSKSLFEVTLESTFENKMLIEASSVEEAEDKARHDCSIDFFQRHIGELVTKVKKVKGTRSERVSKLRKKGFF